MAATLATACGDDNNDDNSVPVESITLNHETLTLKSGATETLVPVTSSGHMVQDRETRIWRSVGCWMAWMAAMVASSRAWPGPAAL